MKLSKMGTLLLTLVLPVAALAQGSGSTGGGYPRRSETPPAFDVTRDLTGTITELNAETGLLVVEDKQGKRVVLNVDGGTRFKADKKTELRDKKNLSLGDFQPGQTVKVTYQPEDGRVLEVRLKRSERKEMKDDKAMQDKAGKS
ncbi:MAG: hypothetical protein L0387_22850 [Acidobacteria bacterium]|nr:hypothetical protein [Acidobacteriota bacterium]MCI0723888.1 hypothetical protein [Acidobacteriota bacterium]